MVVVVREVVVVVRVVVEMVVVAVVVVAVVVVAVEVEVIVVVLVQRGAAQLSDPTASIANDEANSSSSSPDVRSSSINTLAKGS
mmetsp:Transcript_54401/g.158822  ORF Transcript_54401/g.158822 Transcript_54401/m.158822 type:complete len:84 (+) Transcript_54401:1786-2037(+)